MKYAFWGAAIASYALLVGGSKVAEQHFLPEPETKIADVTAQNLVETFTNRADLIRLDSLSGSLDVKRPSWIDDPFLNDPSFLNGAFNLTGPASPEISRPRIYPVRQLPFDRHSMAGGHMNGGGLRSLCDGIVSSAGNKQYFVFADTNHGIPEIQEFIASEELLHAMATAGVKHLFLEIPNFLQDVANDYASGAITEDMLGAISSSVTTMIHATPENLPRYLKAQANAIRLGHQYGMQVHFIDHCPGDFDPKHAELLARVCKEQIRIFRDMLLENPGLMDAHKNIPELMPNLASIARTRNLMSMSFDELLQYSDAINWSVAEGGPASRADMLRYRLIEGDPQLAENIACIAGNDRAAILYGQWHMTRAMGDLDGTLGDHNTFVIDLYGSLDRQQRDEIMSGIHFINLMGADMLREDADAAVCLETQTLMIPGGTYVVYGQSGPPQHLGGMDGALLAQQKENPPAPVLSPLPENFGLEDFFLSSAGLN